MRIGIPVWNGRVSPVLDTAGRLLVVDTARAGGRAREEVALDLAPLPLRVAHLAGLRLDLLVCGAVSTQLAELLEAAGVPVEAWVAGDVDDVLQALTRGLIDRPCYRMPGCRRGRLRRGRAGSCRGRNGDRGRDK